MAITADVKNQLFRQSSSCSEEKLIRLPNDSPMPSCSPSASPRDSLTSSSSNGKGWSADEHERFLEGLELFPSGPWKEIAAHVGTRTTRQTMTHAQKYREKIARRKRGLRATAHARTLRKRGDQQPQVTVTNSAMLVQQPTASQIMHQYSPTSVPKHPACEDPLDIKDCFLKLEGAGECDVDMVMGGNVETFLTGVEPFMMSDDELNAILDSTVMPNFLNDEFML